MIDQVTFLLQQYPVLQHVVAAMVICKIIFKPLFAILGRYVELTVEEKDDEKLHKIMKSKAYKMTAFVIDMISSVRLPKLKEK